ncbi:beta-glucosidase BglX [Mucilaginibacter sp. BT774]|uniref:beta-glucosidase BglX n=1 Tax=Mucilaginibacter sp. BT774 TaxID=3062276 RepID=UPI0026767ED3|nr:beta-glucosidase BglX [Mucilaginibacter sp. BT774]MDO3625644.1 beta-glucosidase BglX [Mucilaginibacter sp. BT774]
MKISLKLICLLLVLCFIANHSFAQKETIDQKVEALLAKMTLDEKIGQLNQYNGDWEATGPVTKDVGNKLDEIKRGRVGAVLNIMGTDHCKTFQDAAMKSRLKIPLLFGQDVIHGYSITFPIPLAEAASWDMAAIEKAERIAAVEASASGINWTFAPMVDIARDPRWGRVMEGAGEDPYLGAQIATARVKGFQGNGIGSPDAVMACAKHFAAYGAAIGGRDYNSVDMSLRTLWEIYLTPFKAAKDAGVATFMNSFNDLNGTPATGNSYLQRDILKSAWKFKGFVVSDWGSIGEMINHGYAKDNYEAAEEAITAGSDMDMESRSYINNLAKLVADKKVSVGLIDDAVRRILRKKFELGLFDDPYKFINPDKEKIALNRPENLEAARDMARKSMVLLKNDNNLLPISKNLKTVALIGPLVKAEKELKGFWSLDVDQNKGIISLMEGMKNHAPDTKFVYAEGCSITGTSHDGFADAVAAAKKANVVIMAMGEAPDMTGEAKSRSNIHLPGVQEDLIKAVIATGKPVVVLLMAGRPMVFNWTADNVASIVYAWWLGTQGGNAMADVLYGDYNPSGKLPITFPRSEGQIPIYYNHYNTGRPAKSDTDLFYVSAYNDLRNSPQYAFGHGLSYTTFEYQNMEMGKFKPTVKGLKPIQVSFMVKNIGKRAGEEVVQLYIREMVSQPVRPIKELKDFKKIMLQPGEIRRVTFTIKRDELAFYNDKLERVTQPGTFQIMIGSASDDIRLQKSFELSN